jgi:hypothetical protein
VRQQIRDLKSNLCYMDETLMSSLCRSSEHDQELLRHCVLLRTAEEATTVKDHELDELQAVKDQEIKSM